MRFPSDIISLYEFATIFGLSCFAVAQQNTFIAVFLLFLIAKEGPVNLSKKLITSPRPEGAMDCNVLNTGGKPHNANGFPSGHTTFATFLFVYTLYEAIRKQQTYNEFLWAPLLVTGLFALLIPIARIHRKCHSVPQVLGGLVYGTVWAFLYILFEQNVLERFPRYRNDKLRFVDSFLA
jgi:membrane-associated phospholipid phosphatase